MIRYTLLRTVRRGAGLLVTLFATPAAIAAQSAAPSSAQATAQSSAPSGAKRVLGVNDYPRWRAIEGTQISANGRWVASVLRFTNTLPDDSKPELHLRNLETNQEVTIAHASNPTFSLDSRWIVYQVDSMPVRPAGGRGGRGGAAADSAGAVPAPPVQAPAGAGGRGGAAAPQPLRRFELRDLNTGATQAWKDIASATFATTSSHLILRRRPPTPAGGEGGRGGGGGPPGGPGGPGGGAGAGGGDAGASSVAPRGLDVILVDLAGGRGQLLGSVGDIAFSRKGDLLAYTVDGTVSDGNGFFVIDLRTGRPYTLDNDAKRYSRISWSADGEGVALMKGTAVERMRERENVILAYADVRAALQSAEVTATIIDPTRAPTWERGWVVSERAPLVWSADRQRIFFGAKAQVPAPDTARRRSTDSIADVDVWRTEDTRIQSAQMIRAAQERNFAYRQAWDLAAAKFVRLADTTMREIEIALDGRWAVGRDLRAYVSDYKPQQADIYRVNASTGERTLMLKGHITSAGGVSGISPDGMRYLYWKDNKYQAYDLDAGLSRTLGGTAAPSFVDTEYDHPGPRPPFGLVGYTPDGKGVVVEHRFDLWLLPLDGAGAPRNITQGLGTRAETHYRIVRTEPTDPADPLAERKSREIDLTRPVTFATYGEYTKKSGFSRLEGAKFTEIVFEDAAYSNPVRAAKAETFVFTRQTPLEFPDLRVSGPNFADATKITNANPQQSEYKWVGGRVLFDYRIKDGRKLQGFLSLPEEYRQGQKLPMIVSFYEKNSQNLNRYTPPSYLTGMGSLPVEAVSRGYITMFADVWFHTGQSHSDMLEAVESATRKVIELGYADPTKIAVHGHSYGGEGAAFIGTRSKLFAAVGMGAGVTDLFTDFSQSWGWSYQVTGGSGENGNNYYMLGQGRWGFSPWDKPEVYRSESAIANVPSAAAPFLIMHGTADPTVSFSEGMNFYNALRFNNKKAVMLAYPGEGHGLRGLANRRDLTTRYFQFFDHFLKGAPAPKWMSEGVPFLAKDLPIVP